MNGNGMATNQDVVYLHGRSGSLAGPLPYLPKMAILNAKWH